MKLTTDFGTYELELIKNNYVNNNRPYYGFIDSKDGEPFCDLSENHPEFSDDKLSERLPGYQAVIIDNDFLNLFEEPRLAKIWIKENIKDCVITGDIDGWDCFYIKI